MLRTLNSKIGMPILPSVQMSRPDNNEHDSIFKRTRLLKISGLSVAVAVTISLLSKVLIYLIDLVTSISFYGNFNAGFNSPASNELGIWVILIPSIGGIIVGIMALYGSKAIRGHGIPEAMEQILTNQSRIKPSIILLKPLSAAIAIGTGGPFGAEGPIIATGSALGSTLGQLLKVTSNERKIILAAGATAGMSAIFGTPIAAIFLAIELLLFEFSPKAILPVALACITGAAGHQLLFETGPVFPMQDLERPSNLALGVYSFVGLFIGLISIGLTKAVYFIEDCFEKLPIHWLWWPAVGGIAVGVIGYFAPHTLGVGYENITSTLSGTLPMTLMLSLCFFKFLSWAIALGSGTSGGTLAPLLTIGGAAGAILGSLIVRYFPESDINIPMAALIGMSSMFAGASRAYLTSIAFALETTFQANALLPLLGACTGSYMVSFFFMKNTIMTEKIARRGIYTPDSYEPDILQKITVAQVLRTNPTVFHSESTVSEIKAFFEKNRPSENHYLVEDRNGAFYGIISVSDIYGKTLANGATVSSIVKRNLCRVNSSDNLARAVDLMAECGEEFLPVISSQQKNTIAGVLSYREVLGAYTFHLRENQKKTTNLSLKTQRKKVLIHGRKLISSRQTQTKKELT